MSGMVPGSVQGGDTRATVAVPSRDMNSRTRFVFGSLVGALIIHVVMVACSSGSAPDAHDAGVISDVRDVIRDVLDVETRDAHAGGDGGTPTCNCPEPARASFSFSGGAVTREGGTAQEPTVDFSTSIANAIPTRDRTDGSLAVQIITSISYYLRDGARVDVNCSVFARPDRSIITRTVTENGMTRDYDTECSGVSYALNDVSGRPSQQTGSPSSMGLFVGARVTELTQSRLVIVLPSIPLRFVQSVDGGQTVTSGSIASITVRADVPNATWLTPPRYYRP